MSEVPLYTVKGLKVLNPNWSPQSGLNHSKCYDQNGHKSCHVLGHVLRQSARMQAHGCDALGSD